MPINLKLDIQGLAVEDNEISVTYVRLERVLEIVEERQNPYIKHCCLMVVLDILRLLRKEFEQE